MEEKTLGQMLQKKSSMLKAKWDFTEKLLRNRSHSEFHLHLKIILIVCGPFFSVVGVFLSL